MERRSVEAVIGALNAAGVRHLIVGGLAVVAHGYVRSTLDIDLVLDPDPEAMLRAVRALSGLGYRPRVPVPFEQFADPDRRAEWAEQKNMLAFTVISPHHENTSVDLLLTPPFEFDAVYARAHVQSTLSGTRFAFVPLDALIAMKQRAGRPQDLADIDRLPRPEAGDSKDA